MDLHQNARLTFRSREALAKKIMIEKVTLNAAAAAFISRKTAAKWLRRYCTLGLPATTSTPRNAISSSRPGWSITISTVRMVVSVTLHPSAGLLRREQRLDRSQVPHVCPVLA